MSDRFPQYTTEYISGVMSLRKPQKKSLEILEDILSSVSLRKGMNLRGALGAVHAMYPTCTDFEREFVSLTFALATGVGKTRLMGAFIAYLYTQYNIRNFFVVAPNTTIYDKLKRDLSDFNSQKYVFRGLGCFSAAPQIITDDDYKSKQISTFESDIRIFVYNIDKFNKEDATMRKVNEIKGGYFHAQDSRDFLSLLDEIDRLRTKCNSTQYAFRLVNDSYDDAIRRCRRFVVKSGGSTIPEGFAPIEIVDLEPIFQMSTSIAITQERTTVYANLKSVGEGSYARVFSYIDPTYSIPIILKRARPELDNKEIARFKQEYEVLKGLHSPYLVEVYSYDDLRNEYTMEFMDESIYDYIRRVNSTLSLSDRKNIIAQICRGLSYIHSKGILHRDISLTNVFVKHYEDVDVVKIGDFGLVKMPQSNLTSLQTELKGSLNDPDLIHVGFANYEMCHETYALTRLCYFILTGRTNIEKQKDGAIKSFWNKGTNTNRAMRFKSVDELLIAVRAITEDNR